MARARADLPWLPSDTMAAQFGMDVQLAQDKEILAAALKDPRNVEAIADAKVKVSESLMIQKLLLREADMEDYTEYGIDRRPTRSERYAATHKYEREQPQRMQMRAASQAWYDSESRVDRALHEVMGGMETGEDEPQKRANLAPGQMSEASASVRTPWEAFMMGAHPRLAGDLHHTAGMQPLVQIAQLARDAQRQEDLSKPITIPSQTTVRWRNERYHKPGEGAWAFAMHPGSGAENAFAMGRHERLGEWSPVQLVSDDIADHIRRLVKSAGWP